MRYVQVLYTSVASDGLDHAEVLDILRQSQERNLQRQISGLLLFRKRRFMQLIEGAEDEVAALLERIRQDPRHKDIEVLTRQHTGEVAMPTWAMAYYSPALEGASPGDEHFVLDYEQARSLCELLPPALGAGFLEVLEK